MGSEFNLLDPKDRNAAGRREMLAQRKLPCTIGDHRASAPFFRPSKELVDAINVALSVGAPLLLTGDPGTGKTQVAYYLAWYFGLPIFAMDVRSTSTANDLLYSVDTVAYFHAAHDPRRKEDKISLGDFVRKGVLWLALSRAARGEVSVVLVDEIDKAPRDFPNDLLGPLERMRFKVHERKRWVGRRGAAVRPIMVITSNSERRLPEPFLRRCVFHHIEFTKELLEEAVEARRDDFPNLDEDALAASEEALMKLRDQELRKKPATAEYLAWLSVLSSLGDVTGDSIRGLVRDRGLSALPALSILIKDRDDLALL